MNKIIEKIKENKLICTVKVDNLEDLLKKVKNIQEYGLDLIEITYRTPLTLEGIKLIKKTFPNLKIGCRNSFNFRTTK